MYAKNNTVQHLLMFKHHSKLDKWGGGTGKARILNGSRGPLHLLRTATAARFCQSAFWSTGRGAVFRQGI